jgi:UDP-2,3-diacylglucosamine pyrophosphatase LpxH
METGKQRRHMQLTQRIAFKAIWVSDVHLGSLWSAGIKHTQSLFRHVTAPQIYLVGDIIEGQQLNRFGYWPAAHEVALQQICALPQEGVRVTYVPGNHDIGFRGYLQECGGRNATKAVVMPCAPGVEFKWHTVHEGQRGSYLVLHGDEGEQLSPTARRFAVPYDVAYYGLSLMTPAFNKLAAPWTQHYVPLARSLQNTVCRKLDFVGAFEQRLIAQAQSTGAPGIICGHVHYPANKQVQGVHYLNCGSMQADFTFLAEGLDGQIRVVDWGSISRQLMGSPARASRALEAAAVQYQASPLATANSFKPILPPRQRLARVVPSRQAQLIDIAINGFVSGKSPVPSV